MQELRTFVFDPQAGHAQPGSPVYSVRVVMFEGEAWWYAADVCAVLGVANPREAVSRLDEDERNTISSADVGLTDGGPKRNVVNESGLYALVLGSRKPEAKAFKRWVIHEVLPSIRKTGGYQAPAFQVPTSLHEALSLAAILEKERMALACKVSEQADDISVLEPKAAFADRVGRADGAHTIAAAAKILGTGQNRLFVWLRVHEFLIQGTCTPFQRHIETGLFKVVERPVRDRDGKDHLKAQTLVTGKGMMAIQKVMDAESRPLLLKPQHMTAEILA